ncbi:MAG: bifunctional methylenetetrahydrofolate dehydrogenase/methenyltetrahydrofolate cyclohydrolase [Holosporaceae bacterium]|jgi:methylenetetrahydrofolate dehydrogenase (NADP+)/methenyltetrahydrofolate cyclohydrolase|nr:bifunctional methylenetetrahydrofolate dehydrogenase/methenyltetrahydrofolate cyclohydrolase [Holosporaceae bacterium]
MATVIDGKKIAEMFCEQMKERTLELKKRGVNPHIALINVGNDPASSVYVAKKEKLAATMGILSTVHKFNDNVDENDLIALIKKLNIDKEVHAILLQSPLPLNFQFRKFVNLIDPGKDVDGLTTMNQGRLFAGEAGVVPCTPLGVLHLLRTVREQIAGLHAVVLGRSSIVGRPLAQLLLNANCTVTLLHSYSKDLKSICKTADILISAMGKPFFIDKEFIKPGAIVIDVGVNRIENNGFKKIVGDVVFDEVSELAAAITPVPNGVGPMTVAYLMHNTLNLACCH